MCMDDGEKGTRTRAVCTVYALLRTPKAVVWRYDTLIIQHRFDATTTLSPRSCSTRLDVASYWFVNDRIKGTIDKVRKPRCL